MKIILRAEAKASHLSRYFTGKPCPKGHINERNTKTGFCYECSRLRPKGKYKRKSSKSDPILKAKRDRWNLAWKARNREKLRQEAKEYYHRTKDKTRISRLLNCKARQARKRGAQGRYNKAQIEYLYKLQKGRCAEPTCKRSLKKAYHIDHIMPLKLNGTNYISNIQLLCPSCNLQKQAKHPLDWARERGRLL